MQKETAFPEGLTARDYIHILILQPFVHCPVFSEPESFVWNGFGLTDPVHSHVLVAAGFQHLEGADIFPVVATGLCEVLATLLQAFNFFSKFADIVSGGVPYNLKQDIFLLGIKDVFHVICFFNYTTYINIGQY